MEALRSIFRSFYFLLLLLLILPLYISTAALRLIRCSSSAPSARVKMRPSSIVPVLAPLLLVLALTALPLHGNEDPAPVDRPSTASEVEDLRAKIARLESILEDNREMMNSKISHLNEKIHLIGELDVKIRTLEDSLENLKQPQKDFSEQRTSVDMEDEVRLLWAKMRENNFDIYFLETKAEDAENKFKYVDAQLQELKDIVTEQWIQIRHLEQALQTTKIRNSKCQIAKLSQCTFLKFFENLRQHLPKYANWVHLTSSKKKMSILQSFMSGVEKHIKRAITLVQEYHHELQHSVKETLKRSESLATFANKEVSFFLASSIIVLPVLPFIFLFVSFFNRQKV